MWNIPLYFIKPFWHLSVQVPLSLHSEAASGRSNMFMTSQSDYISDLSWPGMVFSLSGEKLNFAICDIFGRALRLPPGHHENVKTNCAHQLSPGQKTWRRHLVMTSPENLSAGFGRVLGFIWPHHPSVIFPQLRPWFCFNGTAEGPHCYIVGSGISLSSSQDWRTKINLNI